MLISQSNDFRDEGTSACDGTWDCYRQQLMRWAIRWQTC